jgi:hypothetical protein
MNDLEGLRRYAAELMVPTSPSYPLEQRELSETYKVDYRLATGVEHAKRAIAGLVELHEYVNHQGIAHPAVLGMAREFEMIFAMAAGHLVHNRMHGRYL